ncbi:MAG: hypothetical protein A3J46_03670 [Candidatus Yanofskybacteria bacterium RIFCSPHIGHO2_02_FULL_41_11]|uniref:DUF4159 domain-containing protein n=1 Tax=Candidatus Yanofskybacteria bacterium RIFCSPHIGHO2_02_FULL_41_11 TaxID=1802675 RepID=A0A1F8F7T1_9BACT|nr:MAG: hypothetical protein A3J46_03670 [Candidatus Yanofskybacteria bacterium RIFCSPHIGHO2_02_FULL_41_11]
MYPAIKLVFIALLLLVAGSHSAFGQTSKIWVGPTDTNMGTTIRWAKKEDFDGSFVFCRGYYTTSRYEYNVWGWYVDYPGADNNFMIRLSELTKTRIRKDKNKSAVHVVVRLDSDLIFQCPIIFLSDAGTIGLKDPEIANLREYFKKGGFLWVDDIWGSAGLNHWLEQIRKVLPEDKYSLIDISPVHPIMNMQYTIIEVPQIPNMGFYYANHGQTSERGNDSEEAHFKGIEDKRKKLLVVMTHNTDIADTWERESKLYDPTQEFFEKFSPIGYRIGINIFLYALTD